MLSHSQNNTAVTITPTSTTSYEHEGYAYDNLGRTKTRTDAAGVTTTWTYDTAPGGSATNGVWLGLVAWVTTSDTSSESYTYDDWCRQWTETIGYGGTTGEFVTSYDPESTKVATVQYPDGLVATTSYGCAAVVNGATICLNPNSGVAPAYVIGRSVKNARRGPARGKLTPQTTYYINCKNRSKRDFHRL